MSIYKITLYIFEISCFMLYLTYEASSAGGAHPVGTTGLISFDGRLLVLLDLPICLINSAILCFKDFALDRYILTWFFLIRFISAIPCCGKCGRNAECVNNQCKCKRCYTGNPTTGCTGITQLKTSSLCDCNVGFHVTSIDERLTLSRENYLTIMIFIIFENNSG